MISWLGFLTLHKLDTGDAKIKSFSGLPVAPR